MASQRNHKSTETLQNSFAKNNLQWHSFSSFSLSLLDTWVNIINRYISVSIQKFSYFYTNLMQYSNYALRLIQCQFVISLNLQYFSFTIQVQLHLLHYFKHALFLMLCYFVIFSNFQFISMCEIQPICTAILQICTPSHAKYLTIIVNIALLVLCHHNFILSPALP